MSKKGSGALQLILLIIFAVGVAILLVWGTGLEDFRLWKFFVIIVPVLIYVLFFFASKNSLNYVFMSIFLALPVVGTVLPPRRLGLTVLDVLEVLVVLVLFVLIQGRRGAQKLVPYKMPFIALLIVMPAVFVAIDPVHSIVEYIRLIGLYLVFVFIVDCIRIDGMIEKINTTLAFSIIVISVAIFFERLTGINLSGASLNFNAESYVSGVFVHRPAGLFQDPQKAAQFLAVLLVYFSVLWFYGELRKGWQKRIGIVAICAGLLALLLTSSRLAIASGMLTIFMAYLILGKTPIIKKMMLVIFPAVVLVLGLVLAGSDIIKSVVPESVYSRFTMVETSVSGRMAVWEDAFDITLEHPVAGIGPGNYQEYLMRRNPKLRIYKEKGGFVPNQPENGYLKIIVETGFLGGVSLLLLFVWITKRLRHSSYDRASKKEKTYAWAIGLSMFVYLLTFTTLFTPGDARNALLFVILLGLLSAKRIKGYGSE